MVTLGDSTLNETYGHGVGLAVQKPGQEFLLRGPRGRRVAEGQRQFRCPVEDATEPEQFVLHVVEGALPLRLGEPDLDPELGQRVLEVERPSPAAGSRDRHDVERFRGDLAAEQTGGKIGTSRSGHSRIGQRPADRRLPAEKVHNRFKIVRETTEVDRMAGPRPDAGRPGRRQLVQASSRRGQGLSAGSLHASAPRTGRSRNRRLVRMLQARDEVVDQLTLAVVALQLVTDNLRRELEGDVTDLAPELSDDLRPLRGELCLAPRFDLGDLGIRLRTQFRQDLNSLLPGVLTDAGSLGLRVGELRAVGGEKLLSLLLSVRGTDETALDSRGPLGVRPLDLRVDLPEEEGHQQAERQGADQQFTERWDKDVLIRLCAVPGGQQQCCGNHGVPPA